MPSVLNSTCAAGVGQSNVTVYTAPTSPATTATVIGLTCSNTGAAAIKASVWLQRGATLYSIITKGPVPVGNTLAVVGTTGKTILMPGDAIVAVNDVGTMDVIVSKLEQT